MNQEKGKNHKIRLLHLVHGLGMGGAEIALLHYIQALGMEHYDHYVYFFGHDGPLRKKIEALGYPYTLDPKGPVSNALSNSGSAWYCL
jgi:hypothetical protein